MNFTTAVAILCMALAIVVSASDNRPLLRRDIVDAINSNKESTWSAHMSPRFEGVSVAEAKRMMGAIPSRASKAATRIVEETAGDLPASFDSREQWGKCVHPIRNQAQCGSCWAFSASEVLSDRFCIGSNGTMDMVLSPEMMVACDHTNYGCNGGMLNTAWEFMEDTGLPTDACYPYSSGDGNTGTCASGNCQDGSSWQTYKAANGANIVGEQAIMTEIMNNGPVQCAFQVYSDFMHYSGGVYTHQSGSLLGGHAVKMVGWGTENGQDYWLIANSWGPTWGLQGFFKIARGVGNGGECGIESDVWAGLAQVN